MITLSLCCVLQHNMQSAPAHIPPPTWLTNERGPASTAVFGFDPLPDPRYVVSDVGS